MNKSSAPKWRQTMIDKYGSEQAYLEHMRSVGRRGGKISTPTGGFGADPEKAKQAALKSAEVRRKNRDAKLVK